MVTCKLDWLISVGGEDREVREGRCGERWGGWSIFSRNRRFGHFWLLVPRWQRCCSCTRFIAQCIENAHRSDSWDLLTWRARSFIPQQLCSSNAVAYKSLTSSQSFLHYRVLTASSDRLVDEAEWELTERIRSPHQHSFVERLGAERLTRMWDPPVVVRSSLWLCSAERKIPMLFTSCSYTGFPL